MSFRTNVCQKYPAQLRFMYSCNNHHDRCGTQVAVRNHLLTKSNSDVSSTSAFKANQIKFGPTLIANDDWSHSMHSLNVRPHSSTLNFCSENFNQFSSNSSSSSQDSEKPNADQLQSVSDFLEEHIPKIFRNDLDTSVLHENVEFIDNIRKVQTVGVLAFRQSVGLLKIWMNLRYLQSGVKVLSINKDLENGLIRIRFRIIGEKGLFKLFKKFKTGMTGKESENDTTTQDWFDVIATFTVDKEAIITQIVCDNILPDSNEVEIEEFPVKVAAMFGLLNGLH